MIEPTDAVHALARKTLGSVTVTSDATLPAHVMAFTDTRGRRYLAKRHTSRNRYAREIHAYTHWVPALRDRAPQLVASDHEHLVLLLTAVPGATADHVISGAEAERAAHQSAAYVLRQLHDSTPPEYSHDMAVTLGQRTAHWVDRAGVLLNAGERRLLLDHAETIASSPVEVRFCHLDFQPRNWIVDDDGTVRLIDFEHARPDSHIRDMARLAHRYWPHQPDLYQAFVRGYGTYLSEEERTLLYHFGALEAATALVRGRDTDDDALAMHGRAILDRLARHPTPSPTLWSNP
ncbi:phosphotransferase [Actinophytocola sp.]|uniref:phosphotransferase n=1 Tax=Actinophytocola sp. TaxID=1872138 RepID=UPI00389AA03E